MMSGIDMEIVIDQENQKNPYRYYSESYNIYHNNELVGNIRKHKMSVDKIKKMGFHHPDWKWFLEIKNANQYSVLENYDFKWIWRVWSFDVAKSMIENIINDKDPIKG